MIADTVDGRPGHPRVSDWSPERESLANIEDLLAAIQQTIVASAGVKPGTMRRADRPHTAHDRARARRRGNQHRRLVALLLPDRSREAD